MRLIISLLFGLLGSFVLGVAQDAGSGVTEAGSLAEVSADSVFEAHRDSYYMPIDSIKDKALAFKVFRNGRFDVNRVELDTMLTGFHLKNIVRERYKVGSYLGNLGLSHYSPLMHLRDRPDDFMFTDHVKLYMHTPEEMVHYQARTPFTLVNYSTAGENRKDEMTLHLVHTQNVNKHVNLGLVFDANTSDGQYFHQATGNNAFSFFGSHRGKNYSLFSSLNINNIKMMENGGLEDLQRFYNSDQRTESYTMRSDNGKTILKERSFSLMQSYSFSRGQSVMRAESSDTLALSLQDLEVALSDSLGVVPESPGVSENLVEPAGEDVSRFTLLHHLKYSFFDRYYQDLSAGPSSLYPNAYIDPVSTNDTVYARRLSNSFELMFRERDRAKFTAGFAIGLLNELDKFSHAVRPDTAWADTIPMVTRSRTGTSVNSAITGRFFNRTGRRVNWDIGARFFFTGDKAAAFDIDGVVQYHYYTRTSRNTLTLGGSIVNEVPGYFLMRYESNAYRWNNKFDASQQIRLRAEFESPARRLKAGVYLAQLNNLVYFDTLALPRQSSSALLTLSAAVEKHITLGRFHFLFHIYGQYSSDQDQLPLPSFAMYQSSFYQQWLKRDVLSMQFGYDLRYHTRYYAYDFAPSTGVFFVQDKEKVGAYPFVDVFLNLKLKRVRLSVTGENLSALLGSLGKEYFTTYGYPMPEARIKFGVSWSFYD